MTSGSWAAVSSLGWLTPDDPPGDTRAFLLWCPLGADYEQAMRGALLPLIDPGNWEQAGSQSPDDTAAAFEYPLYLTMRWQGARMIGEVFLFAGSATPLGALPCDGSLIEKATYPALYDAIGDAFGSGDSTHFRLPDMRGRVPIGTGSGGGLTSRSMGDTGGEERHQLTTSEMPSHDHSVHAHSAPLVTGVEVAPVSTPSLIPGSTGSAGGDASHENMQPFLALGYYIYAG